MFLYTVSFSEFSLVLIKTPTKQEPWEVGGKLVGLLLRLISGVFPWLPIRTIDRSTGTPGSANSR